MKDFEAVYPPEGAVKRLTLSAETKLIILSDMHRGNGTGSCVHPRCITGIEITSGEDDQPDIQLIKWAYSAESNSEAAASQQDFHLVISRSVLESRN